MVRIHPDPPIRGQESGIRYQRNGGIGAVAQLGERLLCKQEAVGSIPSSSTNQESEARDQESATPVDCAPALSDEFSKGRSHR